MLSTHKKFKSIYDEIFLLAKDNQHQKVDELVKIHGGIDFAAQGYASIKNTEKLQEYIKRGASITHIAFGFTYGGSLDELNQLSLPASILDKLVIVFALVGNFHAVERCIALGAKSEKAAFGYLISGRKHKVQNLISRGVHQEELVEAFAFLDKPEAKEAINKIMSSIPPLSPIQSQEESDENEETTNNNSVKKIQVEKSIVERLDNNQSSLLVANLERLVSGYTLSVNQNELLALLQNEDFTLFKSMLMNRALYLAASNGSHELVNVLLKLGGTNEIAISGYASGGFAKEVSDIYSKETNASTKLKMALKIANEYKMNGYFASPEIAERIVNETNHPILKKQLQTASKSTQKMGTLYSFQKNTSPTGTADQIISFLYGADSKVKCISGDEINLSGKILGLKQIQLIANRLIEWDCPSYLYVNLSQSNLDEKFLNVFANMLKSGLCIDGLTLDLRHCGMRDSGADILIEALQSDCYLPQDLNLLLANNLISVEKSNIIKSILKGNPAKKEMHDYRYNKVTSSKIRAQTFLSVFVAETFQQTLQFLGDKLLTDEQKRIYLCIYKNDLRGLEEIILKPEELLSLDNGLGAIQYAALHKRTKVLHYFYRAIRSYMKTQDSWKHYGINLETWAACCRINDPDFVNKEPIYTHFTPLYFAVQVRDLLTVKKLLSRDFITDLHTKCGRKQITAVEKAFTNGQVEMVQLFFDKKAKFDFINTENEDNALLQIISTGTIEILKWVHKQYQYCNGEKATDAEYYRLRPLIEAIKKSYNTCYSNENKNPLIFSLFKGKIEITKWMLQSISFDDSYSNSKGQNLNHALNHALLKREFDLAAQFIDLGASVHYPAANNVNTPLYEAVNQGELSIVKKLLVKGAKSSFSSYHTQETPLHLAIRKGNVSIVSALFEYIEVIKGLPNRANNGDDKPIQIDRDQLITLINLARISQHVEVIHFLLDRTLKSDSPIPVQAVDFDTLFTLLTHSCRDDDEKTCYPILLKFLSLFCTYKNDFYIFKLAGITPVKSNIINQLIVLLTNRKIWDETPRSIAILDLIEMDVTELPNQILNLERIDLLATRVSSLLAKKGNSLSEEEKLFAGNHKGLINLLYQSLGVNNLFNEDLYMQISKTLSTIENSEINSPNLKRKREITLIQSEQSLFAENASKKVSVEENCSQANTSYS